VELRRAERGDEDVEAPEARGRFGDEGLTQLGDGAAVLAGREGEVEGVAPVLDHEGAPAVLPRDRDDEARRSLAEERVADREIELLDGAPRAADGVVGEDLVEPAGVVEEPGAVAVEVDDHDARGREAPLADGLQAAELVDEGGDGELPEGAVVHGDPRRATCAAVGQSATRTREDGGSPTRRVTARPPRSRSGTSVPEPRAGPDRHGMGPPCKSPSGP
jgi:hypothetical protein